MDKWLTASADRAPYWIRGIHLPK